MLQTCIEGNSVTFYPQKLKRISILIADDVRWEIELYLDSPASNLILDLAGIEFIDSAGFAMLLDLKQSSQFKGKQFFISNPSNEVQELFALAKLEKYFSIVSEEAYKKNAG